MKRILPSGVCAASGLLQVGDRLVSFNDQPLKDVSKEQIAYVLQAKSKEVHLVVLRQKNSDDIHHSPHNVVKRNSGRTPHRKRGSKKKSQPKEFDSSDSDTNLSHLDADELFDGPVNHKVPHPQIFANKPFTLAFGRSSFRRRSRPDIRMESTKTDSQDTVTSLATSTEENEVGQSTDSDTDLSTYQSLTSQFVLKSPLRPDSETDSIFPQFPDSQRYVKSDKKKDSALKSEENHGDTEETTPPLPKTPPPSQSQPTFPKQALSTSKIPPTLSQAPPTLPQAPPTLSQAPPPALPKTPPPSSAPPKFPESQPTFTDSDLEAYRECLVHEDVLYVPQQTVMTAMAMDYVPAFLQESTQKQEEAAKQRTATENLPKQTNTPSETQQSNIKDNMDNTSAKTASTNQIAIHETDKKHDEDDVNPFRQNIENTQFGPDVTYFSMDEGTQDKGHSEESSNVIFTDIEESPVTVSKSTGQQSQPPSQATPTLPQAPPTKTLPPSVPPPTLPESTTSFTDSSIEGVFETSKPQEHEKEVHEDLIEPATKKSKKSEDSAQIFDNTDDPVPITNIDDLLSDMLKEPLEIEQASDRKNSLPAVHEDEIMPQVKGKDLEMSPVKGNVIDDPPADSEQLKLDLDFLDNEEEAEDTQNREGVAAESPAEVLKQTQEQVLSEPPPSTTESPRKETHDLIERLFSLDQMEDEDEVDALLSSPLMQNDSPKKFFEEDEEVIDFDPFVFDESPAPEKSEDLQTDIDELINREEGLVRPPTGFDIDEDKPDESNIKTEPKPSTPPPPVPTCPPPESPLQQRVKEVAHVAPQPPQAPVKLSPRKLSPRSNNPLPTIKPLKTLPTLGSGSSAGKTSLKSLPRTGPLLPSKVTPVKVSPVPRKSPGNRTPKLSPREKDNRTPKLSPREKVSVDQQNVPPKDQTASHFETQAPPVPETQAVSPSSTQALHGKTQILPPPETQAFSANEHLPIDIQVPETQTQSLETQAPPPPLFGDSTSDVMLSSQIIDGDLSKTNDKSAKPEDQSTQLIDIGEPIVPNEFQDSESPIPNQAPPLSAQAPPLPAQAPPLPAQAPPLTAQAPPLPAQAPPLPDLPSNYLQVAPPPAFSSLDDRHKRDVSPTRLVAKVQPFPSSTSSYSNPAHISSSYSNPSYISPSHSQEDLTVHSAPQLASMDKNITTDHAIKHSDPPAAAESLLIAPVSTDNESGSLSNMTLLEGPTEVKPCDKHDHKTDNNADLLSHQMTPPIVSPRQSKMAATEDEKPCDSPVCINMTDDVCEKRGNDSEHDVMESTFYVTATAVDDNHVLVNIKSTPEDSDLQTEESTAKTNTSAPQGQQDEPNTLDTHENVVAYAENMSKQIACDALVESKIQKLQDIIEEPVPTQEQTILEVTKKPEEPTSEELKSETLTNFTPDESSFASEQRVPPPSLSSVFPVHVEKGPTGLGLAVAVKKDGVKVTALKPDGPVAQEGSIR